jgi:hypothetical protein
VFFRAGREPGRPTVSRRNFGKENKEQVMKFATISKSAILGAALLLASTAFAATKASLQITSPTAVNGTSLQPGDYKVEWDGAGPNVEVSILKGKNVVAKVPAHLVDLSAPAANNAAVVKANGDGTSSLTGVRFGGKKFALEFGEGNDNMHASN